MPKTIAEYLNEVAIAAGLPEDNESLKKLLTFPELQKEAPELMTEDAAKNNAKIKAFFTSKSLDPVDQELKKYLADAAIEEADFNSANGSYKRLEMVIKGLKEAKKQAPDDTDKKKLTDQIKDLNLQLANMKETTVPKEDYVKLEQDGQRLWFDNLIDSQLTSYKYGNDHPIEVNKVVAKTFLEKKMAEKGIKPVLSADRKSIVLKQAASPDLDYFENNKPFSFKDLSDAVVTENKLISTKKAAPEPPQQIQRTFTPGQNQQIQNPVGQQKANKNLEEYQRAKELTA